MKAAMVAQLAAAVLLTLTSGVNAGVCYLVTDAKAIAENFVKAENGALETLKLAESYSLQVKQLVVQAAQARGAVNVQQVIAANDGELRRVNELVGHLSEFYGSTSQARAAMNRRLDEAKALGLNWDAYLAHEHERIQRNAKGAADRAAAEARILQQAQKSYAAANAAAAKIDASSGTHDAMRILNAQANTMIVQAAQLAEALAPNAVSAGTVAEMRLQRAQEEQRRLEHAKVLKDAQRRRADDERRGLEQLAR